jgi:hypothetical protein
VKAHLQVSTVFRGSDAMEPIVGLIPTPAAVTACRITAQTDDRPIDSRCNGGGANEWYWAPMWVAM